MWIFILEGVILCALFTVLVVPSVRNHPLAHIDDYPPAIISRVQELGMIADRHRRINRRVVIRKSFAAIAMAVILAVVLKYFNGVTTFPEGFLTSYGLWLVIAWYDALVLDCLWFCHSKSIRIPGTEDMLDAYHDYSFHIKASALGSLIGVPVCIMVGIFVQFF